MTKRGAMKEFPSVCMDCGNDDPNAFLWDYVKTTNIPAGGLSSLHDVGINVFLGCDVCSSTLIVMSLDDFLSYATQAFGDIIAFANAVDIHSGRDGGTREVDPRVRHPWIPGAVFNTQPQLEEAMDRWRGRMM